MIYKFEKKKNIEVFYDEVDDKELPVIIVNTYGDEGRAIWEECKKVNLRNFILVAISNINWNDDMTPWECDSLFKGNNDYKGEADEFLNFILEDVIFEVENYIKTNLKRNIQYYGIAGYSLGGLFALYSGYKTEKFKRIASVSGSMWYPNFIEFAKTNELNRKVDKVYFSLGNKEKNSKNNILKTVEDNTKEIYNYLSEKINTIYEENEGNHFQDATKRMTKGIKWILE